MLFTMCSIFLFPHLDTCRSKLYMYNNHVVTTSFSYSTAISMYYTPEVTLLYRCVMLHLIKHANLLGFFLIIINNNDYLYKKLLSFKILYLQLYFNLLDTHIAQCYYHLFLILNLYNIFLFMLNYYITVCLLYKYFTFFGNCYMLRAKCLNEHLSITVLLNV